MNRPRELRSPLRHDAVRDTMWIGKGVGNGFLVTAFIVIAASIAAVLLQG
jgi:hypothetical protein